MRFLILLEGIKTFKQDKILHKEIHLLIEMSINLLKKQQVQAKEGFLTPKVNLGLAAVSSEDRVSVDIVKRSFFHLFIQNP